MKKLLALSFTFISSFAFALHNGGDLSSAPKEIVIQESIGQQTVVTLPQINPADFNWDCREYAYADFTHECGTTNVGLPNITIGNTEYEAFVSTNGTLRSKSDLLGTDITWADFAFSETENRVGALNLEIDLIAVTTGQRFTLTVRNDGHGFVRQGRGGFLLSILSNY